MFSNDQVKALNGLGKVIRENGRNLAPEWLIVADIVEESGFTKLAILIREGDNVGRKNKLPPVRFAPSQYSWLVFGDKRATGSAIRTEAFAKLNYKKKEFHVERWYDSLAECLWDVGQAVEKS